MNSIKKENAKFILTFLGFIVLIYIMICLSATSGQALHMYVQNASARNVDLGKNRWEEIKDLPNSKVKLYSEEEIKNDSYLDDANLYFFPSKNNNKGDFAFIIPGGGYFSCNPELVPFATAATINEKNINCFILTYRCGKHSSYYAPMKDLVKALNYINDNADLYNVNVDNYMLIGFSAGGHLASLFGSIYGFSQYGLKAPSTIGLIYPWTDGGATLTLNGNIFQLGVDLVLNEVCTSIFLGDKANDKLEREKINCNNNYTKEHINSINTKFYVIQGDNDFVVNKKNNSDKFVAQLDNLGLTCKNYPCSIYSKDRLIYRVASGCNHGFGLGDNTSAANWVDDIVKLWNA